MKYGNRDQAFNLCEKIKNEKDLLKDLSEPNIQVRIELFGRVTIYIFNLKKRIFWLNFAVFKLFL